jgi:hypothetical protein
MCTKHCPAQEAEFTEDEITAMRSWTGTDATSCFSEVTLRLVEERYDGGIEGFAADLAS